MLRAKGGLLVLPGVLALSSLLRVFKCGSLTPSHWLPLGLNTVGAASGVILASRQKQKVEGQRFHDFFFARYHLFIQNGNCFPETADLSSRLEVGSMATTVSRRYRSF